MADIDYSPTITFLAAFFGQTTTCQVEIRALPQESGSGPARPRFSRDGIVVCEHLVKWDQPARAVYFSCCTRIPGRPTGTRNDCAELPALWCDIDCYKSGITKEQATAAALSLPLRPSFLVDSGGGIHCYWLLNEAIDVRIDAPENREDEIIAVLKQLAGVLAGDPGVCDLARVMRLPGTHNTKDGGWRRCEVLNCSNDQLRYEFSDIVEMLDVQRPLLAVSTTVRDDSLRVLDDPFLAMARLSSFKPPIDVESRLRAMSYLAAGESGIHATQLSVTASLAAQGAHADEIVNVVLSATEAAAGNAGVHWNWKREEAAIRAMVRSAAAKFAPKPPTNVVHLGDARIAAARKIDPADDPAEEREIAPNLAGYPLNDMGNAARLIATHGGLLRYVVGIGWHAWDERRYLFDPATVAVRKLAHKVARAMLLQAFDYKALTKEKAKTRETIIKFAVGSGNTNKISGMLAQAEPHLACEADALNNNQWLLNCLNGTIDIRTGELRPHDQADLITKLIPVEYDPVAPCPTFERFLSEIFAGDGEMVAFLQRALGYSISGSCREQVIFILHGSGANGKSVLLDTIATLLADYAAHCPTDTFTSNERGSGIPNDVARLAGARFVSIVETEHDKKLAEGLVKQATGGDRLTARFMRQEFFEFTPQFKIWLATNHKPRIRGTDNAIWRRIRLIPFLVTFVDQADASEGDLVKDPDLKEKLMAEFPGILRWIVEGCKAWLSSGGILPPVSVMEATKEYRDSQDIVARWVDECCIVYEGSECASGALYSNYQDWCVDNGERTISSSEFNSALTEKGFLPRKGQHGKRMRKGLELRVIYDEGGVGGGEGGGN